MARGRAPNLSLPPTRALTQQREYRARKAARIEELESTNRDLVLENGRLREELERIRSGSGREEEARGLQATRKSLLLALAQIDQLLPPSPNPSSSPSHLRSHKRSSSADIAHKRKRVTTRSPDRSLMARKSSTFGEDELEEFDEDDDSMGEPEVEGGVEEEEVKPVVVGELNGMGQGGSRRSSGPNGVIATAPKKSCCPPPKAAVSPPVRVERRESTGSNITADDSGSVNGTTFAYSHTYGASSSHTAPYYNHGNDSQERFAPIPSMDVSRSHRQATPIGGMYDQGPQHLVHPHHQHQLPSLQLPPQSSSLPYPNNYLGQSAPVNHSIPLHSQRFLPPPAGYDASCCNGLFDCSSLPNALRPTMHQMAMNLSAGNGLAQESFERNGLGDNGSVSGSARGSLVGMGDYGAGGYPTQGQMVEISAHMQGQGRPGGMGQPQARRDSASTTMSDYQPTGGQEGIVASGMGQGLVGVGVRKVEVTMGGVEVNAVVAEEECCFGLLDCPPEQGLVGGKGGS